MNQYEIKIGNYFLSTGLVKGAVGSVFGIIPPHPERNYYEVELICGGLITVKLDSLIGIKIDELSLNEMGFVEVNPNSFELDLTINFKLIWWNDTKRLWLEFTNEWCHGADLKKQYVHEIQNFYFEFMNKPMEFKN